MERGILGRGMLGDSGLHGLLSPPSRPVAADSGPGPTDWGTVAAWLDASDITTLKQGGVPIAGGSGNALNSWDFKASNASFVGGTAMTADGAGFTYKVNTADATMGNRAYIDANGSSRRFTSSRPAVIGAQPYTVYLVGSLNAASFRYIFDQAPSGAARCALQLNDLGEWRLNAGSNAANHPGSTTCSVWKFRFSGAASSITRYRSGSPVETIGNAGTNAWDGLTLWGSSTGEVSTMRMCEFLVYMGSDYEDSTILDYLSAKWNVPLL
jgi:hypothetical protein